MLATLALAVICQLAAMRSVLAVPRHPLFSSRPCGERQHRGSWSTIRRKQEVGKRQLFWDGRQRVFTWRQVCLTQRSRSGKTVHGIRTSFCVLFFPSRERLPAFVAGRSERNAESGGEEKAVTAIFSLLRDCGSVRADLLTARRNPL